MAFYGCEFTFDGRSSHEFGLVVYSLDNHSQDSTFRFQSAGTHFTDRLPWKTSSFHYGRFEEDPAEFTLVFGANPEMLDAHKPFDRWDQEEIAYWLTGKDGYCWLEIDQSDMESFRYRCYISNLQSIFLGDGEYGFSCDVTCDSPYGYAFPRKYSFNVSGENITTNIRNRSSANLNYYPLLKISMNGGASISITNEEFGEKLELTDLPGQTYTITIDNDNQVIYSDELPDFNFYDGHFNFTFLRLKRGDNHLTLSGNGKVDIICEFPVNIGG